MPYEGMRVRDARGQIKGEGVITSVGSASFVVSWEAGAGKREYAAMPLWMVYA